MTTPATQSRQRNEAATVCKHLRVETHRNDEHGIGLWACSDCKRRFYPACPECVVVGHRGAHTPGEPLDGAAAEFRPLFDWATSMPDAGLAEGDPRYDWWQRGAPARHQARRVLDEAEARPSPTEDQ